MFDSRCNIFFSAPILLEFTNLEVSKGVGVKFVSDLLHIDLKDVIAVGDNQNDVPMIKATGLGVAVSNAVDELKEAADYITKNDCDHGAIKEVIEKFIL
ncbi:MAG: HAD-IIB family hydrolase [Clostridiales bacterium]|nr:HAD-IIB family hydrolase [Clostridiales bacterium]